jgi:D-citramalate synthase
LSRSKAVAAGKYSVAPINFSPDIVRSYRFPKPLKIVDSTLRKLLYVSGTQPTLSGLLKVADALVEAGVRHMILNVRWWGDDTPDPAEFRLCKAVMAQDYGIDIGVFSDFTIDSRLGKTYGKNLEFEATVDAVERAGAQHILVPARIPKTLSDYRRRRQSVAEIAQLLNERKHSWELSLGDVGRADMRRLLDMANLGLRLGATGIELSDSYSSMSPDGARLFIRSFIARLDRRVPVILHTHDDFGMASATAVAATTAGANPDVAVNGVSYRAGFAALEEVVLSLEVLYGAKTGIRLNSLHSLSELVANVSGLSVHPLKAVSGRNAHVRDLPHWAAEALELGENAFPPVANTFNPAIVGGRAKVVWGDHTSRALIRMKLMGMGFSAGDVDVARVKALIDQALKRKSSYPRWLTDDEVTVICGRVARPGQR